VRAIRGLEQAQPPAASPAAVNASASTTPSSAVSVRFAVDLNLL
jgi:hypothetical protein